MAVTEVRAACERLFGLLAEVGGVAHVVAAHAVGLVGEGQCGGPAWGTFRESATAALLAEMDAADSAADSAFGLARAAEGLAQRQWCERSFAEAHSAVTGALHSTARVHAGAAALQRVVRAHTFVSVDGGSMPAFWASCIAAAEAALSHVPGTIAAVRQSCGAQLELSKSNTTVDGRPALALLEPLHEYLSTWGVFFEQQPQQDFVVKGCLWSSVCRSMLELSASMKSLSTVQWPAAASRFHVSLEIHIHECANVISASVQLFKTLQTCQFQNWLEESEKLSDKLEACRQLCEQIELCAKECYTVLYHHQGGCAPLHSLAAPPDLTQQYVVLYRGVHFPEGDRRRRATDITSVSGTWSKFVGQFPADQRVHAQDDIIAKLASMCAADQSDDVLLRIAQLYFNNYNGFIQQLGGRRSPSHLYNSIALESLQADSNPFFSACSSCDTAIRYAVGELAASSQGGPPRCLPNYNAQGVPANPVLGKVFVIVNTVATLQDTLVASTSLSYNSFAIKRTNRKASDHELLFLGGASRGVIELEFVIDVPRLDVYVPSLMKKWGMAEVDFNIARHRILDPKLTDAQRQSAEVNFITYLYTTRRDLSNTVRNAAARLLQQQPLIIGHDPVELIEPQTLLMSWFKSTDKYPTWSGFQAAGGAHAAGAAIAPTACPNSEGPPPEAEGPAGTAERENEAEGGPAGNEAGSGSAGNEAGSGSAGRDSEAVAPLVAGVPAEGLPLLEEGPQAEGVPESVCPPSEGRTEGPDGQCPGEPSGGDDGGGLAATPAPTATGEGGDGTVRCEAVENSEEAVEGSVPVAESEATGGAGPLAPNGGDVNPELEAKHAREFW